NEDVSGLRVYPPAYGRPLGSTTLAWRDGLRPVPDRSEVATDLVRETGGQQGRVVVPLDQGGLLELGLGGVERARDGGIIRVKAEADLRPRDRDVMFPEAEHAAPTDDQEGHSMHPIQ